MSLIIRTTKSDNPESPGLPGRDWLLLKIRQVDANLSSFGIASFNYPLDFCLQHDGQAYNFRVEKIGDSLMLCPEQLTSPPPPPECKVWRWGRGAKDVT